MNVNWKRFATVTALVMVVTAVILYVSQNCGANMDPSELDTVETLRDDEICSWVTEQTRLRASDASETASTAAFDQIRADETMILDRLIEQYTARASELESGGSSASPSSTGATQPAAVEPDVVDPTTGDESNVDPATTTEKRSQPGGSSPPPSVSTIGICPTCTPAEARTVADNYRKKRQILNSCSMDGAVAGAGAVTDPEATCTAGDGLSLNDPACQPAAGTEEPRVRLTGSIRTLTREGLRQACGWLPSLLPPQNVGACDKAVISNVCQLFANSTAEGAIAVAGGDTGVTNISDSLFSAFKGSAVACIQAAAADRVRAAAASGLVSAATQPVASLSATQRVALAVCQAGSQLIGDYLAVTSQRDVDYNRPCASITDTTRRSRVAACFQTAATGCRAGAGSINLGNLLPASATEDDVNRIVAQIGSAVASGGCSLGGAATNALCGTISEAAGQIRQALTSGTNDWAHCAGTDQLGACIGTLYAEWQTGASLESLRAGVQQAERSSSGTVYRKCCWCYRDFYEDITLATDPRFRRDNIFEVTGQDDNGATCRAYGSRDRYMTGGITQYRNEHPVYYQKNDCDEWYVKGDVCPFPTSVYPRTDPPVTVEYWADGRWKATTAP